MALLPENPLAKSITLSSSQPVINSISTSGRRQSRKVEGHLWKLEVKYDILDRASVAPLYGFITGIDGGTFEIILPQQKTSLGDSTGTPKVSSTASKGDSSISTNGWTGSGAVMKSGDIFSVTGQTKVHMVTQDAIVGGGAATINFKPPLVEDITLNTLLVVNNVKFTVFVDGDINKWNTTSPVITKYSFKAIEDL